jgi:redox-sensing transcriptional repressor
MPSSTSEPPLRPFKEGISDVTTQRLSLYLRCLVQLENDQRKTVSSQEMAEIVHLNSAQIRKDLAVFGELGIRGVGYNVSALKRHLIQVLGLDRLKNIGIAGAGNLGHALLNYPGFHESSFRIVSMFDVDPEKIGTLSPGSDVPVHSIEELPEIVRTLEISIGVIAVPAEAAQSVYDQMVEAGVGAVLNFAPARIREQPGVKLKTVDLRVALEFLSFYLSNQEKALNP